MLKSLKQPTLHTSRLQLAPLSPEHLQYTKQLDMDPEVMKYIGYGRALTEEEAGQVHGFLMDTADAGPGLGCWSAFKDGEFVGWWVLAAPQPPAANAGADNNQAGGENSNQAQDIDNDHSSITSSDSTSSDDTTPSDTASSDTTPSDTGSECSTPPTFEKAEFGYRISPKFWRQGLGKEGSKEILRHAFETVGVQEVYGETMMVNVGSWKVMASLGLKHTDTFFNTYDTPPPGIEEGEVRYAIRKEEWLEQVSAAARD